MTIQTMPSSGGKKNLQGALLREFLGQLWLQEVWYLTVDPNELQIWYMCIELWGDCVMLVSICSHIRCILHLMDLLWVCCELSQFWKFRSFSCPGIPVRKMGSSWRTLSVLNSGDRGVRFLVLMYTDWTLMINILVIFKICPSPNHSPSEHQPGLSLHLLLDEHFCPLDVDGHPLFSVSRRSLRGGGHWTFMFSLWRILICLTPRVNIYEAICLAFTIWHFPAMFNSSVCCFLYLFLPI